VIHDRPMDIDPAPGERSSIALALANTVLEGPSGGIDLLTAPDDVRDWLVAHGAPATRLTVDPDDVRRLARLRTTIRAVFAAVADSRALVPEHVDTINVVAASAPGAVQLRTDDTMLARGWTPHSGTDFDIALAALATDAIELATGDRRTQIRQCEAHGCTRMFLREHARRRWCSNTCGDRVRAARHYQRVTRQVDG
jgi:predicted RNA-binding Zn ribbon-like protein